MVWANPELCGRTIFRPKATHLSRTIFFGKNHYYFHVPTGPFHCAKFKKNSYFGSRVMMQHFGAKNGLFAPNKNVFGKNDQYHFHLPIGPIHCAKFLKNSYNGSRVMWMCHFGSKMTHLPKWEFFQKAC